MNRTIIALVPDAFGGRGGIAQYNRNLLAALCSHPETAEVVCLPRSISYELEPMPEKLRFKTRAAGSKPGYAAAVASLALRLRRADLIVCSHLHLLPFAHLLKHVFGCPVLPFVYGIEAWSPTPHRLVNRMARRLDAFASIRHFTAERLKVWAGIPDARHYYVPNCIDAETFGVAPRRADLIERYGLGGRTVIATAGRLDPHPAERNKGFDEVMEVLPALERAIPDVRYLIVGDGADRPRLEEKAKQLGVVDRVVFTGHIPEAEKADHYRLAHVFAMPGSNPVFDRYPYRFVFLEALACGVPVVGARLTDPSEADDPDAAALIVQVDPSDPADIERGILHALARRGRGVEPRLRKFFYGAFEARVTEVVDDIMLRRDFAARESATVPSPG